MGQDLGLDGQPGVLPLSDCFAEMGGISVNDDGGEQVEPGHAVVLALAPTDSSGELCRMHAAGEYSISDLAELFSVSRPTVYRTLNRRHSP